MSIKVYVRCEGRLANQLVSWANVKYALRFLADRVPVLNYPSLEKSCLLPGTEFCSDEPDWPRVSTDTLDTAEQNCIAQDAWEAAAPRCERRGLLRTISFRPTLEWIARSMLGDRPAIGVHIRYGDYIAVAPGTPAMPPPRFARAANDYYLDRVAQCQERFPQWNVFLATDGTPDEVRWFTDAHHPKRHKPNDGALDMLTLSKCEIIVGSDSTFSSVAACLGRVPLIMPCSTQEDARAALNSLC